MSIQHKNHENMKLCWWGTSFVARNIIFDTLDITLSSGSVFLRIKQKIGFKMFVVAINSNGSNVFLSIAYSQPIYHQSYKNSKTRLNCILRIKMQHWDSQLPTDSILFLLRRHTHTLAGVSNFWRCCRGLVENHGKKFLSFYFVNLLSFLFYLTYIVFFFSSKIIVFLAWMRRNWSLGAIV